MTDMEFHPIANLFPLLDGEEFEALAEDIRAHGVREPIVVHEGLILDGRNRYRASKAAGADCPMRVFDGADPVAFVVSLNLKRRHLSESQRAWVAAKIANLGEGRPGKTASIDAVSQSDAADMLNVSRASVQRASDVRDHGVEELQQAVEKGEIAVSAAAEIAKEEPEVQRDRVKLPTASEARKKARETGQGVAARDGRVYDGRTREEEEADKERTDQIFRLVRALEELSAMPVTPDEYLSGLPEYMHPTIAEHIEAAHQWLDGFMTLWREKHESRELVHGD